MIIREYHALWVFVNSWSYSWMAIRWTSWVYSWMAMPGNVFWGGERWAGTRPAPYERWAGASGEMGGYKTRALRGRICAQSSTLQNWIL